jgi:type II secretory pathway component PulC
MSAGEIISLVAVSLSIVTALLGGLLWIVKSQVQSLAQDMQPNGGSSTKDQLNRIESDVREVRNKVDDHITWHLND